jgi:hypothetical protein
MNRFERVKEILDRAVGGPDTVVGGPHKAFWRGTTRDQFVALAILGNKLVTPGSGASSNLVRAMQGETPFGLDTGNPDGLFRRMPAGRPPVPPADIAFIARWIDDGCPEDAVPDGAVGALELLLNGAPSGRAFLVVASATARFPATLTLRATEGGAGEVTLRPSASSGATITVTPTTIHVSGAPAQVRVEASAPSAARNDSAIEVVEGNAVVGRLELTALRDPRLRFAGRFQCRLATDPDPYDHPWGVQASFGSFAMQGPDPAHPDEPPLDRIVRFQDAVALRPFCGPIGVSVTGVEAQVGGAAVRFTTGDPLIGQPVRLGPNSVFDSRNGDFAPAGFEPISEFRLEIGTSFAGESAPSEPNPDPQNPPNSTAPFADGVFRLDDQASLPPDLTKWRPADFGYPEATWRLHAQAATDDKLAKLTAQATTPGTAADRIRQRRIREHSANAAGLRAPLQFLQRYRGLIDRAIAVGPDPSGMLAYLASLPAVEFSADFLDYDVDCHSGTVSGTLGTPTRPARSRRAAARPFPGRVPRSPEAIPVESGPGPRTRRSRGR